MNFATDTNVAIAAGSPRVDAIPALAPNAATMPLLRAHVAASTNKSIDCNGEFRCVPCKARGIQGNHTSQTAYFDIPLDAEHGMLLVCSHPECSGSGRRFRYCAVCGLPVAKRNFSKRHGHGLIVPKTSRSSGITSSSNGAALANTTVSGNKHRRSMSYDATEYFYQEKLQKMAEQLWLPPQEEAAQPTSAVAVAPQLMTAGTPNQARVQTSNVSSKPTTMAPTKGHNENKGQSSGGTMKMQLNPREFQWLALLHNRPSIQDTEATNQWMDKVLQLSEPSSMGTPSVTPPSWSNSEEQSSKESEPTETAEMVKPVNVMARTETLAVTAPMTLEQQVRGEVAEIESGLLLAAAASAAADAVAVSNESDEASPPPQKLASAVAAAPMNSVALETLAKPELQPATAGTEEIDRVLAVLAELAADTSDSSPAENESDETSPAENELGETSPPPQKRQDKLVASLLPNWTEQEYDNVFD